MYRKSSIILIVALTLLVVVAALSVGAQQNDDPIVTTSAVYRFADGSEVEGASSQLTRFNNGVTVTISTSDLAADEVYTLWWVVFNEPGNCSDGVCNLDDLFVLNEDGSIVLEDNGNRAMSVDALVNANVSIQHAAGTYTRDGSAYMSASLGLGDVPGIIFGPGLLDAHKAEIHLVIRTHGAPVAELFDAQISTFGGGCDPIDTAPCDDVQFAIHLPVAR
jgi:hypothetical protein